MHPFQISDIIRWIARDLLTVAVYALIYALFALFVAVMVLV
jgi:hypothetical protein